MTLFLTSFYYLPEEVEDAQFCSCAIRDWEAAFWYQKRPTRETALFLPVSTINLDTSACTEDALLDSGSSRT